MKSNRKGKGSISGAFFELAGFAQKLTALTISRWGMESLCAIGRYNDQPMVTLWNTMYQFRNIEYMGQKPILNLLIEIETNGSQPEFLLWSGQQNSNPLYEAPSSLVLHNWFMLVLLLAVFAVVAVVALEFIDRDKR